jgi:hypothetical protein
MIRLSVTWALAPMAYASAARTANERMVRKKEGGAGRGGKK